MIVQTGFVAILAGTALISPLFAQDVPATPDSGPVNFPTGTFGGQQFWSDELVHGEWRIQQNVLTGHYRLLDDRDFRMAWGTYDQCRAKFDELRREREIPALDGKIVVLLHGLSRTRDAMAGIAAHLKNKGYTPINVGYASTRRSLDDHALSLARVLAGLDGADELHFVCHSLGNLVVRRYLGEAMQPQPRWQTDPRIARMVMLGPPNNGAKVAEFFKDNEVLALVFGPSAKQLARDFPQSAKRLATPAFPFAIVAGRGIGGAANPFLDGDDDLLVSVAETQLPGAADFRVVPCLHGQLLTDREVRGYIASFLAHGYLTAAADRQPLLAGPPATAAE
ncbi:MAG: lipase [Pirellulaceae bacterium]|nr:lipase [Pirellulaceae bacterium]